MYYIVYETTNNINNKKYIGMHSTYDLEDSYIGSGKLIKKALKKYGRSSFTREILFIYDSYEEMAIKEKELITESIVENKLYYNLKTGGSGGNLSKETIEKIRLKNIGRKVKRESIIKALNTRKRNGTWYKFGKNHHFYNKHHSVKTCIKVSESLKNYYYKNDVWNKGKKYNFIDDNEYKKFGHPETVVVKNKIGEKFRISKNDKRFLSGELIGHTSGYVTVKDKDGNFLSVKVDDKRINSGELVGVSKGNKWIHNKSLKVRKNIDIFFINEYITNGWEVGMGPKNLKIKEKLKYVK